MSAEPLPRGAEIGARYEVLGHLSRGRRLDVYDAWSHERGCRCVVKAIRPERSRDPRARELLLREGRLLERLSHPNLVRGYETVLDPFPAIVMETIPGQTLAHLIEVDRTELTVADLAQLGLQLGSAVRYLHRNGYLHLDLKPANVIADAGRARLIDLSVARPPGPARPGVGTRCYLAPEQATGGELGPAADVWGLGVVLFEAATGARAFDDEVAEDESWPTTHGRSATPSWASDDGGGEDGDYPQLGDRAAPVASFRDLPADLCALIDRCLEPDPADRATIESLLAGIELVSDLAPSEHRWSDPRPSRPADPARIEIGAL